MVSISIIIGTQCNVRNKLHRQTIEQEQSLSKQSMRSRFATGDSWLDGAEPVGTRPSPISHGHPCLLPFTIVTKLRGEKEIILEYTRIFRYQFCTERVEFLNRNVKNWGMLNMLTATFRPNDQKYQSKKLVWKNSWESLFNKEVALNKLTMNQNFN